MKGLIKIKTKTNILIQNFSTELSVRRLAISHNIKIIDRACILCIVKRIIELKSIDVSYSKKRWNLQEKMYIILIEQLYGMMELDILHSPIPNF